MLLAADSQFVLGTEVRIAQQDILDLGGKDVDATNNQHVIAASGDLVHTAHVVRRARQKAAQITRTITDDRQRLLRQRGKDQFTIDTVGQNFTRVRVNDFRVEVIL